MDGRNALAPTPVATLNTPAYRRPQDVAVVDDEPRDGGRGAVYVALLPDGPPVVLDGTAALIWREAVADDAGPVVTRVAARAGVPEDEVRADVEAFLADLVLRGLLEPSA